jgi:Protein of unknown function (DUF2934)
VTREAVRQIDDEEIAREFISRMISEAAYFCAEKRGFASGHELDDWLEATT